MSYRLCQVSEPILQLPNLEGREDVHHRKMIEENLEHEQMQALRPERNGESQAGQKDCKPHCKGEHKHHCEGRYSKRWALKAFAAMP